MEDISVFGLSRWAKETPDKPYIIDERVPLSFGDFEEKVEALAAGLTEYGIKKGDKLVVSLPNVAEFALLVFAGMKLGALLILANLQFREQELSALVAGMGAPKLAFLCRGYQVEFWQKAYPGLETVMVSPEDRELSALRRFLSAPSRTPSSFSLENDAFVVFTSGSSGQPKGVVVTAGNLFGQINAMAERFHAVSSDVMYIPGPFCQMSGLPWLLLSCIVGMTAVTTVRFDGYHALELIERCRVSILTGVTTMYARQILAYDQAERKPDISSLRTGALGGAPVSREYMTWYEEKAGCKLINTYGMTECPGIIMGDCEDSEEKRHFKSGRPLSNVLLALLNDEGKAVETGEHGEICCKSTGVTKRYFNRPELTAHLLDSHGWFHTGDVGTIDGEGYVTLTGRKKDMIIRGGYNIFPAEIEKAYDDYPDIVCASAIPSSDPEYGQIITLFVQLRLGSSVREEELLAYAKRKLAKYKLPDYIVLVDQIPLLPSGKIDKETLRRLLPQI